MSKDQLLGLLLLVAGVFGIIIYGWLVFASQWSYLVLQLTGFIAVALILAIVSWIGYTMATTPPPKPIEEIAPELESSVGKSEKKAEEQADKG